MKKKYVLLILIVFIIQVLLSNFSYVKAEANTSICAWPSDTMSLYFDFQREMIGALLGSQINEKRFSVSMWKGWLFSNRVLDLNNTALDLVSSSVLNRASSIISNTTTSVVLIALASVSAAQSSTVWLAVLFRDRPIVRDYKTMMDIESELYDVAYFRSKQINIAHQVDWDMHNALETVVEKYQDLWLLATGNDVTKLKDTTTMVDVIWDLLWMNATMEIFIVYDSKFVLNNYQWCMNRTKGEGCVAVLKFSDDAIAKLKSDYKWTFGKCNSNFKSSMSKIGASFLDDQKSGWQDVKDAMVRLKEALVGWWKKWNKAEKKCKGVSKYKAAQITAFNWDGWSCDEADQLYTEIMDQKKANRALKKDEKKKEREKKKEERKKAKEKKDTEEGENTGEQQQETQTTSDKLNNKKTTYEKAQEWFYIYGTWVEYNTQYSPNMGNDFKLIYDSINGEYEQSVDIAMSSDLSHELIKIRWLIEQLDVVEDQSVSLKDQLERIANYQCAN